MKIILENMLFWPAQGGIETLIGFLAKTTSQLNNEPAILCARHKKGIAEEEFFEGFKIIRHKMFFLPHPFSVFNPVYFVHRLVKLQKFLCKDYDAVWAAHPYYCCSAVRAFKGKVPIIYLQALPFPEFLRRSFKGAGRMRKMYMMCSLPQIFNLEKEAAFGADKIVVVSESKKREIAEYYGIPLSKFLVVYPGVDFQRFNKRAKDELLLKELKLKRTDKIILTVSRLSAEKNIKHLLAAFAGIKLQDIYLVVVGDGWQRDYLKKIANKLGISAKVIFTGARSDVERFYSIADIFVLASHYEGFGQVYIEAMASGVPCIGLKQDFPKVIVATQEIIEENNNGFIVDPYSVDDLSKRMEYLLEQDAVRQRMGRQAREICQRRFNWENMVSSLIKTTFSYDKHRSK